jgi:predicted secreted protein
MKPGSILAIYFLFWVTSAFLLLPFGVRTDEEMGTPKVPGQADSAPHKFDIPSHVLRATILATVLFGLYYANWHFGWITTEDLDFYN